MEKNYKNKGCYLFIDFVKTFDQLSDLVLIELFVLINKLLNYNLYLSY